MNSELKLRIRRADEKLAQVKYLLQSESALLNLEIGRFGTYRRVVLKNTVGRFKEDLDTLGKKLKGGAYDIPEGIEMPDVAAPFFQAVNFSSETKWQIANNVAKATLIGTNKVLEMVSRRKGWNFTPSKSTGGGNSGIWWLELLQAGLGIAFAVAQQKEQEETAVQRYEAETDVLCRKVDEQYIFCKSISDRIKELISVSDEMEKRCVAKLEKLESVMEAFDVENPTHLYYYQFANIFIKGISELSKVEILDSNNQLSLFDQQYIVRSRKLLTESL